MQNGTKHQKQTLGTLGKFLLVKYNILTESTQIKGAQANELSLSECAMCPARPLPASYKAPGAPLPIITAPG